MTHLFAFPPASKYKRTISNGALDSLPGWKETPQPSTSCTSPVAFIERASKSMKKKVFY